MDYTLDMDEYYLSPLCLYQLDTLFYDTMIVINSDENRLHYSLLNRYLKHMHALTYLSAMCLYQFDNENIYGSHVILDQIINEQS